MQLVVFVENALIFPRKTADVLLIKINFCINSIKYYYLLHLWTQNDIDWTVYCICYYKKQTVMVSEN